jgi:hypothetical protein
VTLPLSKKQRKVTREYQKYDSKGSSQHSRQNKTGLLKKQLKDSIFSINECYSNFEQPQLITTNTKPYLTRWGWLHRPNTP